MNKAGQETGRANLPGHLPQVFSAPVAVGSVKIRINLDR